MDPVAKPTAMNVRICRVTSSPAPTRPTGRAAAQQQPGIVHGHERVFFGRNGSKFLPGNDIRERQMRMAVDQPGHQGPASHVDRRHAGCRQFRIARRDYLDPVALDQDGRRIDRAPGTVPDIGILDKNPADGRSPSTQSGRRPSVSLNREDVPGWHRTAASAGSARAAGRRATRSRSRPFALRLPSERNRARPTGWSCARSRPR
jgi:hypothetical protein